MPNHVTNRIILRGTAEDIAEFRAVHLVCDSEGETRFDFETVISMPECIRSTESGSETDLGLIALGRAEAAEVRRYLDYPWVRAAGVRTVEEFVAWIRHERPNAVAKAEHSLRALDETGYTDWYSWSCARWGTKWNAYSYKEVALTSEPDDATARFEFVFDTAWSFPQPIFDALAERWPEIAIECACYDEGGGFGGWGFFNADPAFELRDADDTLYEKTYGCPPERDEDDDD